MVVYLATYGAVTFFYTKESLSIVRLVSQCFYDLIILIIHFGFVNFAVRFYRQYLKLTKTLKELDESKAQLQKAYDDLAEVTVLEERQRIAKDIHDTAGHSLTTVIMQTEAAKLIIESDPEEAKKKIIAANLQAKHALEEMRDCVHLLSGISGKETLKSALTGIINESTDGTGIKIRSEIDDIAVSDAKYRFLCNALKEGISNGLRHGHSTAFWFELKQSDGKIQFLLSDNGAGVEINQLKEGFGLSGMSSRAESLGGEVWFVSEPDEGFEIHLTLPTDI
jgi:signal transduction histidine kinase